VSARGVRRLDPGRQRLSLYKFQHSLFQRYLYNELDEAEREYLHEDVGNALEELYADQVDEIVVQLARHFEKAGMAEKARVYLEQAGKQAAARFANDEAVAYLSRALELTPKSELDERYALLLAREQIYGLQGERELQAQDLVTLQELADSLSDDGRRAELALRRAGYALATSDLPATVAAAQEAIDLAKADQNTRGQAMGHFWWGSAARYQGDYETAGRQFEQALALSRAGGQRQVEAKSLRGLGLVAMDQGDLDQARTYFEESLRIAREDGDRRGESSPLNHLGSVFARQGDYERAGGYYEQALAIARETGDRRLEGMLLGNLGIGDEIRGDFGAAMERFQQVGAIFGDMGDLRSEALSWAHQGFDAALQGAYDMGRAHCEKALEMNREIGDRRGEAYVQSMLSWLLCKAGSLEQATTHGQEALRLAQELGGSGWEASAWTALAHVHKSRGELEQAADAYQKALDIHRRLEADNLVVEDWAGLAGVALAQGNLPQAGELVEQILSYAEQQPIQVANDNPLEVYLTCYQVLSALEDARAAEVLRTAHRLLQEQASRINDEALRRSYLENVAAHREIVQEFGRSG
jgi:tetratricopeptide (TPR) repeat protein